MMELILIDKEQNIIINKSTLEVLEQKQGNVSFIMIYERKKDFKSEFFMNFTNFDKENQVILLFILQSLNLIIRLMNREYRYGLNLFLLKK